VSKNTGRFNNQSQNHFLVAENNRETLHQWTHIHFFARPARPARLARLAPHHSN